MLAFNRGEWSEIYGVLFLLVKPKMQIVDSDLNFITDELYRIENIIFNSSIKLEYKIINNTICFFANGKKVKVYNSNELNIIRKELLEKIVHSPKGTGSFEIPNLNDFLNEFTHDTVLKSVSQNKEDINIVVFDNKRALTKELSYSVKSSLGSPATILNSSQNTNFEYIVENLDLRYINEINRIQSKTKLLERIHAILTYGGIIRFNKVLSDSFEYNLKMIDSNLPKYLGNALLYSYMESNKNLQEIFFKANKFDDEILSDKKLGDFLLGISFGFIPGTKWNGNFSVNGGFLLVLNNGEVVVLDLVYYKDEVRKHLIKNSKLDSPSSTRYHMLELKERNGQVYFTLNLQVRYK